MRQRDRTRNYWTSLDQLKTPVRSRVHSRFGALLTVSTVLGLALTALPGGSATAPPSAHSIGPHWVNLNLSRNPGNRSDAAFTWDSSVGHGVLFGGLVPNGNPVADTWTFNGTWHDRTGAVSGAPSARWGDQTAMTYDAADGYVLLFGGSVGYIGSGANDTWAFANHTWTNLTSTAGTPPRPRFAATMTYDPAAKAVVLFGGQSYWASSGTYNDTWEFQHGRWTHLNLSVAPTPRRGAMMVFDPQLHGLVLFGGGGGSGFNPLSSTWTFVNGTWHRWNISGPPGRWWGAMTYDPAYHAVALFGGAGSSGCGTVYGDTWFLTHGKWVNAGQKYHLTVAPSARCSVMSSYDSSASAMIVYGGLTAVGNSDETWELI